MESFPEDRRAADVHGASLAYTDSGEGIPVVFVHGSSQDMRTWRHQAGVFAEKYRTIIYSRRYARPNEEIPDNTDDPVPPHVDDLIALLRTLDFAPAHLVGNSLGGFIALLAAIKDPAAVKSLVLCEPPVIPLYISNNPGPGELLRLFFRSPVNAIRIMRFGMGVIEPTIKAYCAGDIERGGRIFGEALLGKHRFENLPPETQEMISQNEKPEVAGLLGAGFPPLRPSEVRSVKVPALLLAGAESGALFRLTLLRELERLLPNATRREIPNAAHLMHEDNPVAFNETVLAFLSAAG